VNSKISSIISPMGAGLFWFRSFSPYCLEFRNKFKDGTHIKFIGNLMTKNEEDGISKLENIPHLGLYNNLI
jgi:putative heme iron utilization protein